MKTKYQFIALMIFLLPMNAIAQSATSKNAVALASTTQVKPFNLSAILENNQLFLSGNFENGKLYEVQIYDATGYKIYSQSFEGATTDQHFDINDNLNSGKYTVAVKLKGQKSTDRSVSML